MKCAQKRHRAVQRRKRRSGAASGGELQMESYDTYDSHDLQA
jgi:hypothetical protein